MNKKKEQIYFSFNMIASTFFHIFLIVKHELPRKCFYLRLINQNLIWNNLKVRMESKIRNWRSTPPRPIFKQFSFERKIQLGDDQLEKVFSYLYLGQEIKIIRYNQNWEVATGVGLRLIFLFLSASFAGF